MLAPGESIGQALKRFRKLLERHGVSWELRKRKHFVTLTEIRRAKKFRKRFKARRATLLAQKASEQPVTKLAELVEVFWRKTGKP